MRRKLHLFAVAMVLTTTAMSCDSQKACNESHLIRADLNAIQTVLTRVRGDQITIEESCQRILPIAGNLETHQRTLLSHAQNHLVQQDGRTTVYRPGYEELQYIARELAGVNLKIKEYCNVAKLPRDSREDATRTMNRVIAIQRHIEQGIVPYGVATYLTLSCKEKAFTELYGISNNEDLRAADNRIPRRNGGATEITPKAQKTTIEVAL